MSWYSRTLRALMMLAVPVCAGGCAAARLRPEPPIGEWRGEGTYVLAKWASDDEKPESAAPGAERGKQPAGEPGHGPAALAKGYGQYATRLLISRVRLGGNDALRLEAISERGKFEAMPDLGERTWLVAILQKSATLGGGTAALYRITQLGLSTDHKPPNMETAPDEIKTLATCTVEGQEIVLRLHYMDGFVDIFRFHGEQVHKDGTYFNVDNGVIDWSETLSLAARGQ